MKKLSKKEYEEIREYVLFCIVDGYGYSKGKAIKLLNESTFLRKLEKHSDYVLHYNLEYWAEKIIEQEK